MAIPGPWSVETLEQLGLPRAEAETFVQRLAQAPAFESAPRAWSFVSQELLRPQFPLPVHEYVFREVYRDWDSSHLGPPPVWVPPDDIRSRCNVGRLIEELGFETEAGFRVWAKTDPVGFWEAIVRALGIRFDQPPETVADLSGGPEDPRWLPGARLNISTSCFQAPPEQVAVRQHSERGSRREVTYQELDRLTSRVAAGLVALGATPGDRIGLLMPMTIEAVAAFLGILRAGCAAVAIAESFAPPEIARRLQIGEARWVITQDTFVRRGIKLPLYSKLDPCSAVRAIVVPAEGEPSPTLRAGDVAWHDFLGPDEDFPAVLLDPDAYTIILFSSGTTGDPKAIPWDQTPPIKAAADGFLYQDIQPGDVVTWPTSMGWVMGSVLVFFTMINRGTIALFDGHPGTEAFCRFVDEAGVNMCGVVPSLLSVWKAGGWLPRCGWKQLKRFSSTGECSNPGDMFALMAQTGYRPVIEYCGGTELAGGYIASTLLRPIAASCFNAVNYGIDLEILDEHGNPTDLGEGFLVGPSVGWSTELLNRDHHEAYFEGTPGGPVPLRRHGDRIERLPGGFYRVLGRVDDTMNLGGIKVSAVEIELVLIRHPLVRETAAVAAEDPGGGPERLVAYIVPEQTDVNPATLRQELQTLLSTQLNPLFKISEAVLVEGLPRTASNKVMRRLLRAPSAEPDRAQATDPTRRP